MRGTDAVAQILNLAGTEYRCSYPYHPAKLIPEVSAELLTAAWRGSRKPTTVPEISEAALLGQFAEDVRPTATRAKAGLSAEPLV